MRRDLTLKVGLNQQYFFLPPDENQGASSPSNDPQTSQRGSRATENIGFENGSKDNLASTSTEGSTVSCGKKLKS